MCATFEFCRGFMFAAVAVSLSISGAPMALAEANIAGARDRVEVAANGAGLEELLSALRDKFRFSYRSKIPLDHKIDGSYSGSLVSVVKQLLTTYDYVLKNENDELIVLVINRQSAAARANAAATSDSQARTGGGNPAGGKSAQNSSPASNAPGGPTATPSKDSSVTNSTTATGQSDHDENLDRALNIGSQVSAPLPRPSNSSVGGPTAVTTLMQTQADIFLRPSSNVAPLSPSADSTQEAIAASLQRANAGLQALKAALSRQSR